MKERMPISLMIGAGSRTVPLIEYATSAESSIEIASVVSHKALDAGRDVIGIATAKKHGIQTAYFNLVQMRSEAKRVHPGLDDDTFREQYFRVLGAWLTQKYPKRPVAVFMLGWDLVTSEEFLRFFPGPERGVYNVINLHPSQLPDKPGEGEVKLSSGVAIPVIRGEHDYVIKEALRLKLPALGACMHFAQTEADIGGLVIKRAEVPIKPDDTFEAYDERLKKAEEQLVVEVADLFGKGKIRVKNGRVFTG